MDFPRNFIVVCLVLLLTATVAHGDENDPSSEKAQLTEFDNGVRLLVLQQPEESLVQVNIYLSLRGAARNGGMAHFVEHLMFRSSRSSPAGSLGDSLQLLVTDRQGSTTPRNIRTMSRCLPGLLPRLLAVEAERYGQLQPDETDVAFEKNRILGEMDFRREIYIRSALHLRIIAMAFEEEGAGDPLLGDPEMIEAVTLDDAKGFIDRWLRPDRMVVLVSGPVLAEEVVAMTASTFGKIPPAVGELEWEDLTQRPESREFITTSSEKRDVLMVGFRLPYKTHEDAAIAHLTETIMDRENGRSYLTIFEDEALLTLFLPGRWSKERTNEEGFERACAEFWDEFRKVKHRVRNSWLFERNRTANVELFRERINQPFRNAVWRAQRLADDRELPDPMVMAALVDSLDQETINIFFEEQFTKSRAFTAYCAGRVPKDVSLISWNRYFRLQINPYLSHLAEPGEPGVFTVADAAPVLAAASVTGFGKLETIELPNGIAVHVLETPAADRVYFGGVSTFPGLESEAIDRDPGRLLLYDILVNAGYGNKGGGIEPRGKRLTHNINVDPKVNYLTITADGSVEKIDSVIAAMHKRIAVSKLNPYALDWVLEKRRSWVMRPLTHPGARAWSWKTKKLFGADHPFAGWLCPNEESIDNWSIGKANKFHWNLFRTGNFQMVVTGDMTVEMCDELMGEKFGKLREAVPGKYPLQSQPDLKSEGAVVHAEGSSVALVEFLFPPQSLVEESSLGPTDFMVMESMMKARLRYAVKTAGLDSVKIRVNISPAGFSALPTMRVVSKPVDGKRILEIIKHEIERLEDDSPSENEEATARLLVLGPLIENLVDPETARDFFLDCAVFGEIPEDPLQQLCRGEFGIVPAQTANYFNSRQHAWTVLGDTTLACVRDIGPVISE